MAETGRGDFLSEIMKRRRVRVSEARERRPFDEVRRAAETLRAGARARAFRSALEDRERVNVIAEFKRASPSKGVIREGVAPAEVARMYETGGASAISVLTEEDFFLGSLSDLEEVKRCARLPVVRKDFIFDEYQVYEAAAAGADAVLLIVAALDDERLARLRSLAEDELGVDALVEVHAREEMRRALDAGARLVGVNNRDLRTFKVSLDTSFSLAEEMPAEVLLVSESGISSAADIERLRERGFSAFLIGETLMRAERPEELLRELTAAR